MGATIAVIVHLRSPSAPSRLETRHGSVLIRLLDCKPLGKSLHMTLTNPVQPRALSEEGLGRMRLALFRNSRYNGKTQNLGVRRS